MKNKFLVTLATGKTGWETTLQLLKDDLPVKIFVRSANAKALALQRLGAEISMGEFDNFEHLKAALKDVKSVYYCYPIKTGMDKDVALFIKAAKESNVESIVFMGQWLAEFNDQESVQTISIQKSYRLLEQSGLNVVYLIPGYFVGNNIAVFLEFAVQLGILTSPFGKGKNPVVSNEDLAACIVSLLKNPAPYYGKRLRPTGPKSLSMIEMADVISKVAKRKVKVIDVPEWMFLKAAFKIKNEFGYDDFTISQAKYYNIQYQQNKFDVGGVTNVVKELTGKNPESFEIVVRRLIQNSSFGMPNKKAWFRAMKKFMMIPFQPTPGKTFLKRLNC